MNTVTMNSEARAPQSHYLAFLFQALMCVSLVFAFMPSFLRLGGSRTSLTYLFLILCMGLMLIFLLKDGSLIDFFRRLILSNGFLAATTFALFLLHLFRFLASPGDGVVSRTLIAHIVYTTGFLYFSFLFYNDRNLFHTFYRLISACLLLNLAVTLLQVNGYMLGSSAYEGHDRYPGLFSHPNQLGIVISTVVTYYGYRLVNGLDTRSKAYALLMLVACLVTMIMSGSKTNLVICLVILAAFFSVSSLKSGVRTVIIVLSILSMALMLLIGFSEVLLRLNPRMFEVLATLSLSNIHEYRTLVSRFDIWSYSWEAGTAFPYIGEGFKGSIYLDPPHSHNVILNYLRIFGPLGMVLSTLFLLSLGLFRRIRHHSEPDTGLLLVSKLSIMAYLLANMMSDSMGPQTVFFLGFFVAYLAREALRDKPLLPGQMPVKAPTHPAQSRLRESTLRESLH